MDNALKLIAQLENLTVKLTALHSNLEVISTVIGDESKEINRKTQDDLYGALAFTNETLLDMAGMYETLIQNLEGEIKNG